MIAVITSAITWFLGVYDLYNKMPVWFHGLIDFAFGLSVGWVWRAIHGPLFAVAVVLALPALSPAGPPKAERSIDQRVTALEIKTELLQRQLADVLAALQELDKTNPTKKAAPRRAALPVVRGRVSYVTFTPARKDGLLDIQLEGNRERQMVLVQDKQSQITWNGNKVADVESLLRLLAGHRADVALYPELERYGAATKAEFTSVP